MVAIGDLVVENIVAATVYMHSKAKVDVCLDVYYYIKRNAFEKLHYHTAPPIVHSIHFYRKIPFNLACVCSSKKPELIHSSKSVTKSSAVKP